MAAFCIYMFVKIHLSPKIIFLHCLAFACSVAVSTRAFNYGVDYLAVRDSIIVW